MTTPTELLDLLRRVRALRFVARSDAGTGWDGVGVGAVEVSELDAGTVVFTEAGEFRSAAARPAIRFHNLFRWSLAGETLRLEHLRFGPNHPVHLFDMATTADGTWREVTPHLCREDCYTATLTMEGEMLIVAWTIRGPKKWESIRYEYR